MPDRFISQLPADSNVSGSELVPILDTGLTPPNRAATTGAIADLVTKSRIGLANVDNTSDLNKPVSTATQTALNGKASTGAIGSSGLTMATLRILGRTTAGEGGVELISVVGATMADQTLTITGATDLSYNPATRTVASSTGGDAVLTLADDINAGLMSSADYLKLLSLTFGVLPVPVYNNTGATIAKGTPVYVTGSSGTRITIAPADASAEATAARTLGLTAAAIANNSEGTVIAVGELTGLNTSTLVEGEIIWLSETTGAMTTTRPTQPAHGVVLGYCVKQGAGSSGIIYVKVDNGLELDELHDILITGKATGQALMVAADGLWKNRLLVAADLSDSSATGRAVVTAVDQAAGRTAIGAEQAGAAAAAQAFAIQRGNHTGTQPANTITGLATVATSGAYADLSGRFDPASPGAIGGATPAAGTFTGLILPAQGSAPAAPATGFRLFAAASNALSWIGANGLRRTFDGTANTADRVYTLPDASGTVGLLSSATPQPPAATASAGTATDAARADHVHQFQPSDLVIPLSGESANLTVSTVLTIPYWPRAQVLTAIPIWMVNTAPAGAALQFDIRVGGTSIFSTLPTIAAGGTNSTTTTAAVFSTAFVSGGQAIALGSSVTFLVTQIGSSTAGAGLKVALPARRAG